MEIQPELSPSGASAKRPGRGRRWRAILLRTLASVSEHRILSVAAGVTFYALLALFPLIAALISLYGLLADPRAIETQLDSFSGVLPGGGLDIVKLETARLAAQTSGSLGFGFFAGLAVALWSASGGLKALFDALNIVYDAKEQRGFVKLTLVALVFALGAAVFLLIALSAVVVLPIALNFVGLGNVTDTLLKLFRWPTLLILTATALAFLYRFGPSTVVRWRWISWGSAGAALLWVIASLAFSFYVERFGAYNRTYGSLGAAVGFMTWIWLSTSIVLLGAELNAGIEQEAAREAAGGGGGAILARGAERDDKVGAAGVQSAHALQGSPPTKR